MENQSIYILDKNPNEIYQFLLDYSCPSMLLNIINDYSAETNETLRNLWHTIIVHLAKDHDPKKILSFLSKCAVIGIDEKNQTVYIGIPNEFVLQQVKKFFHKDLGLAIKHHFNTQYKVDYATFTDLQTGDHTLQIDLKKLLNIQERQIQPTLDATTKETMSNFFGILFESRFRLDNFVVGANSQLAYSAAEAVAAEPGQAYNPLFVYGDVGLGKTHLMQAIGNAIIANNPDYTVVYLPTTKFIDHIVKSIRSNKLGDFLRKLEEVDALMLDDIQFLAGKEKTQEIFHNIFNDFQSKNKQIVVSSDQPPKSLTLLEARLQSRFSMGLVVDIKPPDTETRIAIMESKLNAKGEQLDSELLDLIAQTVTDNVRELEGALNIILTKKQLLKRELTTEDILESLETLGFEPSQPQEAKEVVEFAAPPPPQPTLSSKKAKFDTIVDQIAAQQDVDKDELLGASRKAAVSAARQMAMYIAKTHFGRTLERIGTYFGGKNHASVIYAIKRFEDNMSTDTTIQEQLDEIV